jgi:hypothetical protein
VFWAGLKNGELLTVAETEGIEVFVTGDKTLTSEQNLTPRRISIVVLSAIEFLVVRNSVAAILAAIEASIPGSVQIVQCGSFAVDVEIIIDNDFFSRGN